MSTFLNYVLILDDHPLVASGIAHFLKSIRPDLNIELAGSWLAGERVMQTRGQPELLIADIWLEDGNSLQQLPAWHARFHGTPWLAISGDDDPATAHRALQAGADGFVHKQAWPGEFGLAVTALLQGGRYVPAQLPTDLQQRQSLKDWAVTPAELGMTERQGQILALLLRGLSNKRIAIGLDIAESTVKEHVTAILQRLGVRTRVEAITHLRGRRLVVKEKS